MKNYKLVEIRNHGDIFFTTNEVTSIDIVDFHPVTNAPLQNPAYELIPNNHKLLVQYRDGFLEIWEVEDD